MSTPPLGFLQPPKSFRGLSPRELMSAELADTPGVPAGPAGPVDVPLPIKDGELIAVMLRQPSVATDYGWGRPRYDCRGHTHVRLIAHVVAGGAFGSRLYLERTTTPENVDTWETPGASSQEVPVSLENTGWVRGPWVPLGSVGDYGWRVMAIGGDGSVTPQVLKAHAQFRRGSITPQVATPPTDDLPAPIWWSKSGDLMYTDYDGEIANDGSDESDVSFWGDKTGNGFYFRKPLFALGAKLDTDVLDPRGLAGLRFFPDSVNRHFRQNPGSVAGRDQVTVFVVKKHYTATPATASDTGVWHYGRRINSNDAAHPWIGGGVWESFGQGFHVLVSSAAPGWADWHVWCVRSDVLSGASGLMDTFFNGGFFAQRGIIGYNDPNRWPIEARGDAEGAAAYLGRSWSHQGHLWVSEIIAYGAALTDAQILTKSNALLGL